MLFLLAALQSRIATHRSRMEEEGASAVEYALLIGVMIIGVISAASLVAAKTDAGFNRVNGTFPS